MNERMNDPTCVVRANTAPGKQQRIKRCWRATVDPSELVLANEIDIMYQINGVFLKQDSEVEGLVFCVSFIHLDKTRFEQRP